MAIVEPNGTQKEYRTICVGTGRDGTLSTCRMIEQIFVNNGRQAMNEYSSREFYQAYCDYQETRDKKFVDQIRRLIVECPYDCIIGNGYAAILPLFSELWAPRTRLVHIRRTDREACISSLMKNCEMFPTAYGYYSSLADVTNKRMAAFHFGEMKKEEWDRLAGTAKFAWYYDKTHALIDQHKGLFAESVEVCTETLSDETTRRAIAKLVTSSDAIVPRQLHLNAHTFDIASVAREHRDKASWLFGQLNWEQIFGDDVYAIEYFLNRFTAWTGYQIIDAPQLARARRPDSKETAATLARARAILESAINDIDAAEKLNRERGI